MLNKKIVIVTVVCLVCTLLFSFFSTTKADDTNLARFTWTENDWSGEIATYNYYITRDTTVLSPSGNPTIRVGPTYWDDPHGGTREVNCDNDWTVGRGSAGQHVYFSVWAKTQAGGINSDIWKGAFIGCDLQANVHFTDPNNMPPNMAQDHFYPLDVIAPDYVWINGELYTSSGRFGELPNIKWSDIHIPWGTDWTHLVLEFTVPTTYYTNAKGWFDGQAVEYPISPVQIQATSIWLTAWGIDDPAIAWFGDPEWYINPSSIINPTPSPTSTPTQGGGGGGGTVNPTPTPTVTPEQNGDANEDSINPLFFVVCATGLMLFLSKDKKRKRRRY